MPDNLAATFFHRSPVTSALLVAAAEIYLHLRRQQREWPPLGPLRDRLGWLVCGYSPRLSSWLGPAARTLPASSVAIVGVRLEDWYGHRNSTLGHVLRHATNPIDPVAPRQQAAPAAAASEPNAAAAEAAAATPESEADDGDADSLSGFSTGSSTFEAEAAARYAVSKRDRAQALDAIQAELASAVDKFRPRARYRAAINRLEAAVSLLSEWVTTHRFGAPSE